MAYTDWRKRASLATLAGSSLILANQASKWETLRESANTLETLIKDIGVPENFIGPSEFGLAVAGGLALLSSVKHSNRSQDFNALYREQRQSQNPSRGWFKRATDYVGNQIKSLPEKGARFIAKGTGKVIGAVALGGLVLASSDNIADAYHTISYYTEQVILHLPDKVRELYNSWMGPELNHVNANWAKAALAYIGLETSSRYYSHLLRKRHGPTLVRIYKNQRINPLIWLFVDNLKKWGWGIRLIPQSHIGLPKDMEKMARVTCVDYRTKPGGEIVEQGSMWHRISEWQTGQGQAIFLQDNVRDVLDYLVQKKGPGDPFTGREAYRIFRRNRNDMYERFTKGTSPITPDNLTRIICYLTRERTDLRNISIEAVTADLTMLAQYSATATFERAYYLRDASGAPVLAITLREDIGETRSRSEHYFGKDFAQRGRLAMAYRWGHKLVAQAMADGEHDDQGHADGIEVDLHDDQHDHTDKGQTQVNYFIELRPSWNLLIFGPGFGTYSSFQYKNSQYFVDLLWMRSGGFIDFGRNGHAIRRVAYVTNADGDVVASIKETIPSVFTKWLGNKDYIVDIYDPKLANERAFWHTITLYADALVNRPLIVGNRLKQLNAPPQPAVPDVH